MDDDVWNPGAVFAWDIRVQVNGHLETLHIPKGAVSVPSEALLFALENLTRRLYRVDPDRFAAAQFTQLVRSLRLRDSLQ